MACCHFVTQIDDKFVGDPLDIKMFEQIKWSIEDTGKYPEVYKG